MSSERFKKLRTLHFYFSELYAQVGNDKSRIHFAKALETATAGTTSSNESSLGSSYLPCFQAALAIEYKADKEGDSSLGAAHLKALWKGIKDKAITERFFEWCARSLSTATSLDALPEILRAEPDDARELLERILYCHFLERWMTERRSITFPMAEFTVMEIEIMEDARAQRAEREEGGKYKRHLRLSPIYTASRDPLNRSREVHF
jgi:hypothetical protein